MGRHQEAFAKAKKDAQEAKEKKEEKARVWIQGPKDRENKGQVFMIFLCICFSLAMFLLVIFFLAILRCIMAITSCVS